MSLEEINTAKPAAQARLEKLHLERLHRGALAAYSVARILRESHSLDDGVLETRDTYGLLLAMEYICYDLYAHNEAVFEDFEDAEGQQ